MRSALLVSASVLSLALAAAPATARPPSTVELQLLGVSDLHGNLEPPLEVGQEPAGGVAYLATHVRRQRAANPHGTLLVHAGDMVGGSPLISSWFHDEPAIEATNRMRFDAGTIGNHELDEGQGELLRLLRGGHRADGRQFKAGADTSSRLFPGATYPYVSANVVRADSGRPLLAPFRVLRRRGVRVGLIGATTLETTRIVAADHLSGLRLLDLSDAVNGATRELRRRGVRTIVVLAHAGGEEILSEARQMSPDVDAIVAGHTHRRMDERIGRRVVVQSGRYGTGIARVRLTVRRRDGQVVRSRTELVDVDHAVAPDRSVAAMVRARRQAVAPVAGRVVAFAAAATTRVPGATGESALGELVAEAQRRAAGAEIALVNPGSLRADLPPGPVTFGQAFAAQPWGEDVVRMTLSGAELRRALQQQFDPPGERVLQISGLTWRRVGTTVEDVQVGGEPLDDGREYAVAVNGRLAEGADGFTALAGGRDVVAVGGDVETLVEGLAAMPQPFSPPNVVLAPRIAER